MTPQRRAEIDERLKAIQLEMDTLAEELRTDHAPGGSNESEHSAALGIIDAISRLRWLLARRQESDRISEQIQRRLYGDNAGSTLDLSARLSGQTGTPDDVEVQP